MQKPLTPPGVKQPPLDAFIKNLLRSGLLDRTQVDAALRALPPAEQTVEVLSASLIKAGKLTRFQAFKVMNGAVVGLVLGPFQVLAPLGKGGMGNVYLARDSRNRKLVALKVLPPKRAREEDKLRLRFQREMNISRMLNHPRVARSYDAGIHQNVHYIAMEFIPGQSMYKLVSSGGPLPVPRAARLFAEVTEGLEHAHSQGLIHRDLKPSNILVTPNDHAKVLDLGLAIIQGEVANDRTIVGGQGYVVGTMDYLAPEQAEDAFKVDGRADIYSMGCSLYYVLTGRPPFPGGNALQKIMRHYTEEPAPVEQVNPSIPPAFADIVRKMMVKKAADRYQTMAQARKDLAPWFKGERELPLDKESDPVYQKTVLEISGADLPQEMLWAEIVQLPAPAAPGKNGQPAAAGSTPSVAAPPAGSAASSGPTNWKAIVDEPRPAPLPGSATMNPPPPRPGSATMKMGASPETRPAVPIVDTDVKPLIELPPAVNKYLPLALVILLILALILLLAGI